MTKPIHSISMWPINAAVWLNHRKDNGEEFYSVTLERTFKDGENYKSSGSFNRDDLLQAAKCLDLAHSWIVSRENSERKSS